jgi:peptidoglycan/LPS O-acetylase OafA/YrhL
MGKERRASRQMPTFAWWRFQMGMVRFLLALGVVFGHIEIVGAANMLVGGRLAVECFYFISGFLISYILTEGRYSSIGNFYKSRYIRLFPTYIFIALLSIPIAVWSAHRFAGFAALPLTAKSLLLVANATLFGGDWVMFSAVNHGTFSFTSDFKNSNPQLFNFLLIPPSWTLGVELSFYAVAPFIIKRWKVLLAILVVSLSIRLLAIRLGVGMHDPWTYRFFPLEIALFIIGAFVHQLAFKRWRLVERIRIPLWLPTAIVSLIIVAYGSVPVPLIVKVPILLGSVVMSLPWLFGFNSSSKLDSWIGDLSYPIYVSHWFVIECFRGRDFFHNGWPADIQLFSVVACCILVAVFLKIGIADQVEAYRKHFRSKRN